MRSRLLGWEDYEDDERQGFLRISADDIDEMGTAGIVTAILERIGIDTPTYLSLDIDVLDPGLVSRSQFSPSETKADVEPPTVPRHRNARSGRLDES